MIPEKKPVCNAFPCPRGGDRTPETCYCSIQKRLTRRHVPAPAAHQEARMAARAFARPARIPLLSRGADAPPGSPLQRHKATDVFSSVSRVEPWSVQRLTLKRQGKAFFVLPQINLGGRKPCPKTMNSRLKPAVPQNVLAHLFHVMAQAVKRLWPEVKLAIGPSIDNGFYYDFDAPFNFTQENLPTPSRPRCARSAKES